VAKAQLFFISRRIHKPCFSGSRLGRSEKEKSGRKEKMEGSIEVIPKGYIEREKVMRER